MRTGVSRPVLLLAIAIMLSSCGLRTWVDVEIESDSSGTVTLQLAADQALRDGLASFSPDVDVVEQLSDGLVERDWIIEPSPLDGDWEGIIATNTFGDLAELERLVGEAVQGASSAIEFVETDAAFEMSAALGPPEADDNQADLIAQAGEVIDLDGRLSVRFPVRVTESNGVVTADGSGVTWTYDEDSLTGLEIRAVAAKPGPTWVVPVAIAVVLAGLVGGWWLRRRSRTKVA